MVFFARWLLALFMGVPLKNSGDKNTQAPSFYLVLLLMWNQHNCLAQLVVFAYSRFQQAIFHFVTSSL